MSSISIIGVGSMASALAGRALTGGNTVEIIGRDPAKAKALAAALGGATVGTVGTAPAGDIVIVAVPYASAAAVVSEYGDALDGKVIVDITNPITPDFTGFVTPEGSSGAQEIAKAAPAGAHVVKAFNTLPSRRSGGRLNRGSPTGRVHRRRRRAGKGTRVGVHREPGNAPDGRRAAAHGAGTGERHPAGAGPRRPLRQAHQLLPRRQHPQLSAPASPPRDDAVTSQNTHSTTSPKDSHMHVFVTGGTGHAGSHIIPELIAAGHEVTGLARSDASAAALSALGAKVRRGSLEDLDGLKEAAADSDGVIHVAHRQDLLPTGGMDAVAAAELPIMLAYGEALAGTGKPLVAAGSIGSPGNLGRPATEEDPALPSGEEHKGTLRARNVVERAVIGLAEQGVRSSIVRLPAHRARHDR